MATWPKLEETTAGLGQVPHRSNGHLVENKGELAN